MFKQTGTYFRIRRSAIRISRRFLNNASREMRWINIGTASEHRRSVLRFFLLFLSLSHSSSLRIEQTNMVGGLVSRKVQRVSYVKFFKMVLHGSFFLFFFYPDCVLLFVTAFSNKIVTKKIVWRIWWYAKIMLIITITPTLLSYAFCTF